MIGLWPPSTKFFDQLKAIDGQLVEQAQRRACTNCGGRLARADYPRKARGIPRESEPAFAERFSLCCSRDGCRRRLTPASVRFFGRRVYAGAIFVMASMAWLLVSNALGVGKRTLRRWRGFWSAAFPGTAFWCAARALLMPPVDEARLPLSIFERFHGVASADAVLLRLLLFIAPATTPPARLAMGP